MPKTIVLLQVFVTNKVFTTNEVGGVKSDHKLIEKCGKLSKIRKLSKFQKSAKLGKKLSKNRNSPNFDIKKNEPNFLILDVRIAFNHLQLTFTKAPII